MERVISDDPWPPLWHLVLLWRPRRGASRRVSGPSLARRPRVWVRAGSGRTAATPWSPSRTTKTTSARTPAGPRTRSPRSTTSRRERTRRRSATSRPRPPATPPAPTPGSPFEEVSVDRSAGSRASFASGGFNGGGGSGGGGSGFGFAPVRHADSPQVLRDTAALLPRGSDFSPASSPEPLLTAKALAFNIESLGYQSRKKPRGREKEDWQINLHRYVCEFMFHLIVCYMPNCFFLSCLRSSYFFRFSFSSASTSALALCRLRLCFSRSLRLSRSCIQFTHSSST